MSTAALTDLYMAALTDLCTAALTDLYMESLLKGVVSLVMVLAGLMGPSRGTCQGCNEIDSQIVSVYIDIGLCGENGQLNLVGLAKAATRMFYSMQDGVCYTTALGCVELERAVTSCGTSRAATRSFYSIESAKQRHWAVWS